MDIVFSANNRAEVIIIPIGLWVQAHMFTANAETVTASLLKCAAELTPVGITIL